MTTEPKYRVEDFPQLELTREEDLPTPPVKPLPPKPQNRKLEPEHMPFVFQLLKQEGASLAWIIDQLEAKYGYRIDKSNLSRAIKTAKLERAELVATTASDAAGAKVIDDIAALQQMKAAYLARFEAHTKAGETKQMVEVGKELRALTAMLLELGGARTRSIEQEGQRAKDELLEKFQSRATGIKRVSEN